MPDGEVQVLPRDDEPPPSSSHTNGKTLRTEKPILIGQANLLEGKMIRAYVCVITATDMLSFVRPRSKRESQNRAAVPLVPHVELLREIFIQEEEGDWSRRGLTTVDTELPQSRSYSQSLTFAIAHQKIKTLNYPQSYI